MHDNHTEEINDFQSDQNIETNMDLDLLEDPHNSNCDKSSSLNPNKNTSALEITKCNESISTEVQDKEKSFHFKVGGNEDVEISKQQKSVMEVIATSSVINTSKINENNLHPQAISVPLNNDSSISTMEETKLNESPSIKVQNQKNIVNFKIGDKGVEIIKLMPFKKVVSTTFVINRPKINENNVDQFNSHCRISNPLNKNIGKNSIEGTKAIESTSTNVQEQKKTVNFKIGENNGIEIIKQAPIKKMVATTYVIKSSKIKQNNIYIRPNNLNLEKKGDPQTVISNVKILPKILPSQVKNPSTISVMPSATCISSKTTTVAGLHPNLIPAEITNNKCVSTLKPGLKIIPSSDSKSKMLLIQNNGVKYILKKMGQGKVENQSLSNLASTSTAVKPLNSFIPITVAEKFKTFDTPKVKKNNLKFVIGLKEFPSRKVYVILPFDENISSDVKHLFKSNPSFQLIKQNSSTNTSVKKKKKSTVLQTDSMNSKLLRIINTTDSKLIQQATQPSYRAIQLNEINNSVDFGCGNGEKSHIPHTVTSQDVINNCINVATEKDEAKLITNCKKEFYTTSRLVQLSPKPECSTKTYGQPLTIKTYG